MVQLTQKVTFTNHKGSSSSMEAKGEIELFLHSFENQNLMHITFAGDGYSGCFGSVREECEKSRIGYTVKEGCVGHIQKRL